MALTDTAIRGTKPGQKPFKMYDRDGLFLLVNPSGSKLWRWRYYFEGKEKLMALGEYATAAIHLPHVLSDLELVEAELAARLVLNQLGADKTERIDLVRSSDGIQVKGIVATTERKNEIESRLRLVPHVIPVIYTFQEFDDHTHGTEGITGIQTASVIADVTPLEKYLLDKGRSREDIRRISVQLFNDAASLTQDGKAIDDLLQRFDQDQRLTPEAHGALAQLLARHQASLLSSLDEEDELVAELGIPAGDAKGVPNSAPGSLRNEAEQNIHLCKELISGNGDSARTADAIVPDLLASVRRLRVAVRQADSKDAQKH